MRSIILTTVAALLLILVWNAIPAGNAAQTSAQIARHEPHMSAALGHLREAQAELEKATPNKGGYRERALQLTLQAISQVQSGIQYYDQHVSPMP